MRRLPYVGTEAEYENYFRQATTTSAEIAMLRAHATAEVLTMREIAEAAGWTAHRPANGCYGRLARKIREFVGLPLGVGSSGISFHVLSLFDDVGKNGEGELLLRIHPEVVAGVRAAGLLD